MRFTDFTATGPQAKHEGDKGEGRGGQQSRAWEAEQWGTLRWWQAGQADTLASACAELAVRQGTCARAMACSNLTSNHAMMSIPWDSQHPPLRKEAWEGGDGGQHGVGHGGLLCTH